MDGEKMEWALDLNDGVSKPGSKMEKALGNVDKALKRTGDESEKSSKRQVSAAEGAANAYSMLAMQIDAVMSIAGRVGGFLFDAGRKVFDFGNYAVQAAEFKEDTLIALAAVRGSKQAAQQEFEAAVAYAAKTPFETKDIARWDKALAVAGYTAGETAELLKVLTDVGSLNELRPDIVDRLAEALGRLKGEGHLAGDVMRELRGAGVQDGRLFAELEKMTGRSTVQLKKLVEEGLIPANMAVVAIRNAVANIGGGQIGKLTEEGSKSAHGLFSTVASRPFEMLMNLDTTPGFDSLKRFLGKVADTFDRNSAFGKKISSGLLGTISNVFSDLFGQLDTISSEAIVTGFGKGLSVIEGLGRVAFAGVAAAAQGALGNMGGLWDNLTGPNAQDNFAKMTVAAEHFGDTIGKLGTRVFKLGENLGKIVDLVNMAFEGWDYLLNPSKMFIDREANRYDRKNAADHDMNDPNWDPNKNLSPVARMRMRRQAEEEANRQEAALAGTVHVNRALDQDALDRMFGDDSRYSKDLGGGGVRRDPAPDAGQLVGGMSIDTAGAQAGSELAQSIDTSARDELGIHSPSTVFEEIGRYSAMGFQNGFSAGSGVQAPAVVPAAARGGSSSGAPIIQVQVGPITVNGSDSGSLVDEILQRLRAQLPSELLGAFEQLSLEIGGG